MSKIVATGDMLDIARLLGVEGKLPKERYQEPTLHQTKRGVWYIRPWIDVIRGAKIARAKKTITIGSMGKREARAKMREVMATINRADYLITSQINFGAFLVEYEKLHVERLSASTRGKYLTHIKNRIRPTFEGLMLCEVTTLLVQQWVDGLMMQKMVTNPDGQRQNIEVPLSWAAKTDIRNILSSIFTKAIEWGRWKDRNPIEHVRVGKQRAVREQRKLTVEQTQRLLAALPEDVRLMCCVGLFCTLRVSELLGLQEKHLDFERGEIRVRQRFYRGDLDETKTRKSRRETPMGYLGPDLKRLCIGDPERFVFQIKTRPEWGRKESLCRDDRDILQHFIRPAAVAFAFYWPGFGWHSLRREAITELAALLGPNAAQRMAGQATADMTLHYTLADREKQDQAVRVLQERIIGKTGEKVQ